MAPCEPPVCDDTLLWNVTNSGYSLPVLAAADETGLFVLLARLPADAEAVAEQCHLALNPARAALGLLCSLGFLAQRGGRFHVTDVTRTYLLPDSPYYWGHMLRQLREPTPDFGAVLGNLRDGVPITQQGDRDLWQSHAADQERAVAFTRAMHSHSLAPAHGVARRGDFSGVRRLLDIGGASGCFSIEIARRHAGLSASVLDLAHVCGHTRGYVQAAGLGDRIDAVAGDMFRDPWPGGCDAVFFSNIFHDWDPQRCRQLVEQSHAYLPPGGRIYIHEMLLNDNGVSPAAVTGYSVDMALYTGGKQYSAAELGAMLQGAGFGRVTCTHTHGYFWLVTGYRE
ncbi:MAG: ubiquinone/menaquinone biosynthesis protein [Gammaproteobacteria bacterium]|nr:ubiquinone/menaquinone biosynthesis protein [Gammaproteobacteria bacterium]